MKFEEFGYTHLSNHHLIQKSFQKVSTWPFPVNTSPTNPEAITFCFPSVVLYSFAFPKFARVWNYTGCPLLCLSSVHITPQSHWWGCTLTVAWSFVPLRRIPLHGSITVYLCILCGWTLGYLPVWVFRDSISFPWLLRSEPPSNLTNIDWKGYCSRLSGDDPWELLSVSRSVMEEGKCTHKIKMKGRVEFSGDGVQWIEKGPPPNIKMWPYLETVFSDVIKIKIEMRS